MSEPVPSSSPLVAITGAHGWLGSCLTACFREHGWRTRGLVRQVRVPEQEAPYQLADTALAPATLAGATALVHCAYDFAPRTGEGLREVNVAGTERLFRAAREAGVSRLVYISTMSAFPAARSLYGQTKLAAEEVARQHGAFILRPGLIAGHGPQSGGMFGHLQRQVAGGKFLPVIAGEAVLYAVDERDLGEIIWRFCEGQFPAPATPLTAAHPHPWPFGKLLAELARRAGTHPTFVPLPWRAVWLGLKTAETLGLKLNFRSDSVVSLANQDSHPDFASQAAIGFQPREV